MSCFKNLRGENMRIKVRKISPGYAEGELLIANSPISFLGDVDPKTGKIINERNELYGETIVGKIFAFPYGVGSTVGSYVIYQMKKYGTAPAAIINERSEIIIAVGAIISDIPAVDGVKLSEIKKFKFAKVNASEGWIELEE